MSDTLQAPTDTVPQAPLAEKKRRKPRRYRLFDDGTGDFRIYEVITAGHKTLPAGVLAPLPEFQGYESAVKAKQALRGSGDKLTNKSVLILRGVELVKIEVETKPTVKIVSKPRKQVSGPTDAE